MLRRNAPAILLMVAATMPNAAGLYASAGTDTVTQSTDVAPLVYADSLTPSPGFGAGPFVAQGFFTWTMSVRVDASMIPSYYVDCGGVPFPCEREQASELFETVMEALSPVCGIPVPDEPTVDYVLAAAKGLVAEATGVSFESCLVDDTEHVLAVYGFVLEGGDPCVGVDCLNDHNQDPYASTEFIKDFIGAINVADTGPLDAVGECDQFDANPGLGRTWRHDYTLQGTIKTVTLNANIPVDAKVVNAPGKCDPDGIEEDLLSTPVTLATIFGIVPMCGEMTFQPNVTPTVVDGGGAKVLTHTGWEMHGAFDVLEKLAFTCSGVPTPAGIHFDVVAQFLLGT